MTKSERLFFDSNVYIHLLKDPNYQKRLTPLLQGAYLYVVNKIVLMELWAGAKTTTEETILLQHQKAFPLIGLRDDLFILAGQVMAQMRKKHRFEPHSRRRITWDILIALSSKENSAILVTENISDFDRIAKYVEFEYMAVPH